ncbi:zinc finger, CCHC-type containing protein [Tanacetum coccineum]
MNQEWKEIPFNFDLMISNIERVGSESLDGGVTEKMNQPGIKEDIYTARTPIGRQSVGGITNQKAMINLDLRKITTTRKDDKKIKEEEQLLLISKYKTAKEVWDALKTRHVGVNRVQQAKQQTLKSEFEMLQMEENESIDSFVTRLTGIINKAASVGLAYEDSTLVRKLLNAVPDRFLQIVASIEQYSDLDEMSVDEAIGRLKTFEERLKYKNERPVNTQEGLLFTRHEDQGQQFRRRGHGGFNQSRGQENNKFRSERKNWESSQNNFKKETDSNSNKFTHDKSKVLCFKCKEYGHFANKCPSKKEEQSNLIEEDLEPTLLMATVEETPGSFVNQEESRRVGSENLDGGVTESMSRPGIKEDIYAARTPIGRQSVGSITNQKHDQSGFMIDHNNEGGSNQKNMINLDLRKITAVKVEVTEEKLIYLDVRMITSTTRNQSSSSSNGGFNQKMDQEDLKTYDKAIVIKEENVGLIPICWRQRQLQNSYS